MELPKSVIVGIAKVGASIGAPGVVLVAGIVAIMATSALAASPSDAQELAQIACGQRAEIASDLKSSHDEDPAAIGVTTAGTVMELWTAREGATWTLIVTLPDGNSCVVGAGEDWIPVQQTAKAKGEPS